MPLLATTLLKGATYLTPAQADLTCQIQENLARSTLITAAYAVRTLLSGIRRSVPT